MLPQFISFGPFMLNVYPLLIGLAVLGLLAWHWFRHRDVRVFAVALVVAVFALAFGRADYVALNWDYFHEHLTEIVSPTGLSEHAAILGAVVGYWVLVKARQPITNNQYSLALAFVLVTVAASLGCIPNGCAYGREVFWQTDGEQSLAWLLRADWPDATLVNNPRWPTQTLLAAWMTLGGIFGLAWTRRQGDKGTRTSNHHLPDPASRSEKRNEDRGTAPVSPLHFVIWFAAGDFLVQFLRGDAAFMPGGLRIYQWFDAALAGLAVVLIFARRWQNSKQSRPLHARNFE